MEMITNLDFSRLEFISTTSGIITGNVKRGKSYIKTYDFIICLICVSKAVLDTLVLSVIIMTYEWFWPKIVVSHG